MYLKIFYTLQMQHASKCEKKVFVTCLKPNFIIRSSDMSLCYLWLLISSRAELAEVLLGSAVSQARERINNGIATVISICTLCHVTAARNYPHDGEIIPFYGDRP
jgi:hypothetical protein